MISTPHALLSEDHPRYLKQENHRKGNLILHNNSVTMTYNQNGHHDIMRQKRHNEPNDFYPPPPKLTTFATEDMSEIHAEQQQSYQYMVITNFYLNLGIRIISLRVKNLYTI